MLSNIDYEHKKPILANGIIGQYILLNNPQLKSLNVRVYRQNVQHLSSGLNLLKVVLERNQPDVIALPEHELSEAQICRKCK